VGERSFQILSAPPEPPGGRPTTSSF